MTQAGDKRRRASLAILGTRVELDAVRQGPLPEANVDRFGRAIDYLRISITDRCNLRCIYCMPEEGIPLSPKGDLLTFEEIVRIAGAARRLGFQKFRITGGEPLVVRNVVELVQAIAEVTHGATLCLTTTACFWPTSPSPCGAPASVASTSPSIRSIGSGLPR